MPLNLTQTAKATKRFLVALGLFFVLATISYIGYQVYYYQYYLPNKPKPVVKPDERFGPLPAPKFIDNSISSSNYSYSLATVTGGLPTDIPKIGKVYFIPKLGTTLLASDKATQLANSFGFTNGPQVLSETQYKFTDDSGGSMTIDLNTSNFQFTHIASSSAQLLDSFPDENQVVSDFKSFLDSKHLLSDDLKNGRSKVSFDGNTPQTSQTATISLWPADFDNLEIATPTFTDGLIRATLNKAVNDTDKYLSLNYTYWSPDPQNVSTYPLKTPDKAFSDLKSGQGIIVQQPQDPQIAITSVKLAYYESDTYNLYLLPIYLFEGQNFAAYVNAISSEAVK